MDERFYSKYKRVLEILPDVAECTQKKFILVGGTALALFHLKHRISIDLDFVPLEGNAAKMKETLKGCLSRKGFRTSSGVYTNQFVIQFEDTSIKVEVFIPDYKIKKFDEHSFGNAKLRVASLDDIFEMKLQSYSERMEARDLYDIIFILKSKKQGFEKIRELIAKFGFPKNFGEIRNITLNEEDRDFFSKVIENASKAGN
ncbi:Nucleotidyl transferase AbiEii toxin, Type IV TA system [Candidatus Gugararchaeum adminiculabundum]|nr:Nucleotidyl transferase AbiEii toxin, Type IV TA system [Candidatus Gugararchaeum adminiculabundum]